MGQILQIICGAVLALGLMGAQPVPKASDPDKAPQQRQPASNPRPQVSTPSPERERERRDDEDQPDEESQWLAVADLWAQGLMALFALGQIVLTGVGIWYIRKTLVETEKALEEAGKATEAARDAVAATRDSAEKQLRAYVFNQGQNTELWENSTYIDTDGSVIEGTFLRTYTIWLNSGQTPSTVVHSYAGKMVTAMGEDPDVPDDFEFTDRFVHLGPGRDMRAQYVVMSSDEIDRAYRGDLQLFLYSAIRYLDVFGQWQETRVCWRVEPYQEMANILATRAKRRAEGNNDFWLPINYSVHHPLFRAT